VPAEQRSNALRRGDDPHEVLEGWGRLTAEVSPRASPLLVLLRTAAQSDPQEAALHEELDQARLSRMADNARFLTEVADLRPGIGTREARDVLWLCSAPEMYELLLVKRRWTRVKFSRFLTDNGRRAALTPTVQGAVAPRKAGICGDTWMRRNQ
jgi:hypothetical protein